MISLYKLTRCGISSQKTKTANQYVTRDAQTLLSALSKMSIKKATAEIQTELDKLHEFYQKANKTSITIPEILRIGIYYLAYRYSKEQEISGRSNRISIEKYIEHELGLSKNAFNKWHMHPRNDYAFFQDKVRLHIYRPGRKTGNLLNMIRYLAVTSECENFVDVFGGTGAVSVSISAYFENVYTNEFDMILANFLRCVKEEPEEVIEQCRSFCKMLTEDDFTTHPKFSDVISEMQKRRIEPYYATSTGKCMSSILAFYTSAKSVFGHEDLSEDLIKSNPVTVAAMAYFIMGFKVKAPVADNNISGLDVKSYIDYLIRLGYSYKAKKPRKTKLKIEDLDTKTDLKIRLSMAILNNADQFDEIDFGKLHGKTEIEKYSKRLQNVSLYSKDFEELYRELANGVLKDKMANTIWYFDPPYFRTVQYDIKFSDDQHVALIQILKRISDAGGKWAFSCKERMTNQSESKKKKKKTNEEGKNIIQDFYTYFQAFLADQELVLKDKIYVCQTASVPTRNHKLYVYHTSNVAEDRPVYEIVIANFRCDTKDANSPKEPVMDCPAMVLKKYVNMLGIPDVQVERYEDFLIRIEKELSSDMESDSSNEICENASLSS